MQQRWLITGASGQLGGHIVRRLQSGPPAAEIFALTRRPGSAPPGCHELCADLRDAEALRSLVREAQPTHIIHTAAVTAVSEAFARPQEALLVNLDATRVLAECAAGCAARLIFTSTDMVFDGESAPYREDDPPRPLSHYGRTKAAAERELAGRPGVLIVRLPLLYGLPCTPRQTTFLRQMQALRRGEPLPLFTDEFRTPLWLADAAAALVALARSEWTGLTHVAGPQRLSRYGLIERCAALLRIERPRLVPASRLGAGAGEPRPADLSLDGRRFLTHFPELAPRPVGALNPRDLEPPARDPARA
jgi:dTDP-4-dehydrorhamnose reductase